MGDKGRGRSGWRGRWVIKGESEEGGEGDG